jgi:hypothetical protein
MIYSMLEVASGRTNKQSGPVLASFVKLIAEGHEFMPW